MLPKTLLYDNVSLTKQLNQVITNLCLEEKKASYSWTQVQKRFITQQALKQENQGMRLLATYNRNPNGTASTLAPPITAERSNSLLTVRPRISVPNCHTDRKLDREKAFIDVERRSRRKSHPVRDTRFVRLYSMLSDVKLSSRLDDKNQILTAKLVSVT